MVAVSARWGRVVIAISRESLWNTCLFRCGRSTGVGERFTAGNSYCSELSDTICDRHWCGCVSQRRFADLWRLSLVSRAMRWHRVRTRRGCDSPNVFRHRRDDPAHRRRRGSDWACAHSMGKLSILHQLQLNQAVGIVIRPTWIAIVGSPLRRLAWCNRNVAGWNLLPPAGPISRACWFWHLE